jgi:exodeoxyribonuclease VII small subunit
MTKQKITYNKAIKELEQILLKIENEELDVDDLSDYVKRASVLVKMCEEKLKKTESDVEKILDELDGDE